MITDVKHQAVTEQPDTADPLDVYGPAIIRKHISLKRGEYPGPQPVLAEIFDRVEFCEAGYAPAVCATHEGIGELKALIRYRSTPRGIVLRINIVPGAADGVANRQLARDLATSVPTVLLWRKGYESEGLIGLLEDKPRSGRPKRISEERETAIVEDTMKTLPKDATQWSVRAMAAMQKVSSATVQRIWKKHKL